MFKKIKKGLSLKRIRQLAVLKEDPPAGEDRKTSDLDIK